MKSFTTVVKIKRIKHPKGLRVMEYLPKNPAILVSSINMMLRDEEYESLESLCDNFNTDPEQIKSYLYDAGYVYSEEQEQFRPIGFDE